jgi:hypothetical protein
MATWTDDELSKIGSAEELQIAPRRPDGTLAPPRTIWVVRHGDDLYVRSVRGRSSDWFRGTQARHEGQVQAGGVRKDVSLTEPDADVSDDLDAAYRSKYRRYAQRIVDSVLSRQAQAATLKLAPRA